LPEGLNGDYINFHEAKLKNDLFQSLERNPFQYQGFFDKEGLFVNDKLTLEKWLNIAKGIKIKYDLLNIPQTGVGFLVYQYFRFKFFHISLIEGSNEKKELLQRQFDNFLDNNRQLHTFLKNKDFKENEIEIIFNYLSNNHFEQLNIRVQKYKTIEFFRLCYLFYIFDYFQEARGVSFTEENDFSNLFLENKPGNIKDQNNQFLKYFKNVRNSSSKKNYPFTTVDKTIIKIQERFKIQKGKLKIIPKPTIF
jgi:hypothetical protein